MSLLLATRGYALATVESVESSGVVSITTLPLDRWTPVIARVTMGASAEMWIVFSGSEFDEKLIFWPTRPISQSQSGDQRWTPMFRDRSSVVQDGGDMIVTILPNSGWWRENFRLIFISGTEMTQGA